MKTTSLLATTLAAGVGVVLAQEPPQLRVSMIALGIRDPARSIRFYGETLGLQMAGKPGEVTLFNAGGVTLALNHPLGRGSGDALVGAVEVIFQVASVAASHKGLAGRGCVFVASAHEVTAGLWAATFTDPDGHRLTLLGPH